MPLTKCSHDDHSDILQLQLFATVGSTTPSVVSTSIRDATTLTSDNSTTTASTSSRRWEQGEHDNYDGQAQQHPYLKRHQQKCNTFLSCQTYCHHQHHQLQHHTRHHYLAHSNSQQKIQPHPVHNHNHHHHHHHHYQHHLPEWRRNSCFPYSPSLSTSPTLSPSSLYSPSPTLSAKAGKVCSKSCINNGQHVVGGGCLRLFDLRLASASSSSSVRKLHFVIFILLNLLLRTCCGQLLINVQNQGGEVIQESITSNISEDLITLEFQKTDGTLITQIIDFRNEVCILKTLVLGEEERGQNLYQVMCFVTKFNKGDFISSDAMAKLRQKNPSTIRTPEEDKGKDTFIMTSWVHLNRSQPITRHLISVCGEAPDATYVRDVDLKAWSELPGSSISSLEAATDKFPDTLSSRCNEVSSLWAPCICTLETCIGWYPCGLKYCKGKQVAGDTSAAAAAASNYRCGIKTCRKCSQYSYYVRQKQQCLWDE